MIYPLEYIRQRQAQLWLGLWLACSTLLQGCGHQDFFGNLTTSSTDSADSASAATIKTTAASATSLSDQKTLSTNPCRQGEYQETFAFDGAGGQAQAGSQKISTNMLIITDQSSKMGPPLQAFKTKMQAMLPRLSQLSHLSIVVLSDNEPRVSFLDLLKTQVISTHYEGMGESRHTLTRALEYLQSSQGMAHFNSTGSRKYIVVISNDRPDKSSSDKFVDFVKQLPPAARGDLKFIAFTDVYFNKYNPSNGSYKSFGNYNQIAATIGGKAYDTMKFVDNNIIRPSNEALIPWQVALHDFEQIITNDIVSSTPKLFKLQCPATSVDVVELNQHSLSAPSEYKLSQESVLAILAPLTSQDTIKISYQYQPEAPASK